jgi:Uma2 family endonuclease
MSAAPKRTPISVEEYLAGELVSPIKHEYIGGAVYAMAGARNQHNRIAGNIFAKLHARLSGKPCEPWNSDTKIRVRLPTHIRFYYPDGSVICRPNPPEDSFQDDPVVIVEVLSKKTRRVDTGEKQDAYLTIPSLAVYLLVESDSPFVIAFRRTEHGFVREVYDGRNAALPLAEIDVELPLSDIYEGVTFVPEPDDEESGQ